MVVMGESTAYGMSATSERFRWARVVADQISEFQDEPVKLYNRGIPANVVSPRSPGYEHSAKPSALERYEEDVIKLNPDLVILAYGLNDMRCGNPVEQFREDLQRIISDVKAKTRAVIVLLNVYHITQYRWYPPFDVGGVHHTEIYNLAIRQLADANGCIHADVYAAEGRADWLVHPDGVHANNLGHKLIGNRVFEAIANSCSCLSLSTHRLIGEGPA